jgi:hypothetical protein
MRIKYDVVATVGTYKDSNGQEKKRYLNVGKVFEHDKGGFTIKLESLPVGPEWSGWLSLFEPKQNAQEKPSSPVRDRDDVPF